MYEQVWIMLALLYVLTLSIQPLERESELKETRLFQLFGLA